MAATRRVLAVALTAAAPAVAAPAAHAAMQASVVPASGPAGTALAMRASGLQPARAVTLRSRGRLVARTKATAAGRVAFSTRIPEGARGLVRLVLSQGRRRVVGEFRIDRATGATDVSEAVAESGARLRWRPRVARPGEPIEVAGAHWPGRGRVTVARRAVRASAAGRFRASVTAPRRAGRVTIVARDARGRTLTARVAVRGGPAPTPARPAPAAPSVTPPAAPQPAFPIRAAFYHPSYPEAWRQNGFTAYTRFSPGLGLYDSAARTVIASHVASLEYGGVEAAIASWAGPGSRTDLRFGALLAATRGRALRWAAIYEPERTSNPSVADLREHLTALRDTHAADPSYLRVGGRFVVFVRAAAGDGANTARRWAEANTVGAYVVLRAYPGSGSATYQPDSWHRDAAPDGESSVPGRSFTVSPGLWRREAAAARLPRDPGRFRASVRRMNASGAPWQLVASFNDWGAGTAVENAGEWPSPSGHGAYLDILHQEN